MTKEEIKALTEEQVEARAAELAEAAKADGADLEAIEAETLALEERRAQLIEQRKADAAAVAAGAGEVIEKREEKKRMKTIEEIRASREYEEAYANYIKTGKDREVRTLLTDATGEGGQNRVPIPTYLESKIETSWTESRLWSAIRRKVSVKGIMRVRIEEYADPAVVHTENTERPAQEKITFSTAVITPKNVKKWIEITDEVLGLSGREFLDYIYDEIEYKIVHGAESEVWTTIWESCVNSGAINDYMAPTELKPSVIFEALGRLADAARNPVALMSKATFYSFMALTDLQGRPIYNVVTENGKPSYYINGVEVIFVDAATTADDANYKHIIVGDLDGVLVNLPNGDAVDVVYDPYTKAPDDVVVITGKLMVGAAAVRPWHFCAIQVGDAG